MKIELDKQQETISILKEFLTNYQELEKLAIEFKTNPQSLIKYFAVVGSEVLNRSKTELQKELLNNFENVLTSKQAKQTLEVPLSAINSLLKFFKSIEAQK